MTAAAQAAARSAATRLGARRPLLAHALQAARARVRPCALRHTSSPPSIDVSRRHTRRDCDALPELTAPLLPATKMQ